MTYWRGRALPTILLALMLFSLTEKERFNAMVQIAAGVVARDAARLTLRPLTRRVDLKETTSLTGLRIRS